MAVISGVITAIVTLRDGRGESGFELFLRFIVVWLVAWGFMYCWHFKWMKKFRKE